ncbi:hypothetical protein DXG03_004604 [Asterophora parasitica]|uniref:Uncharacterized protein n=1 Tax=Asterophora parasitica TaxID=117018 RepID=A0A9P7GFF1_9AGAR|nr:hypothetical protein DXG03_004604 [Asterophora parasitica]
MPQGWQNRDPRRPLDFNGPVILTEMFLDSLDLLDKDTKKALGSASDLTLSTLLRHAGFTVLDHDRFRALFGGLPLGMRNMSEAHIAVMARELPNAVARGLLPNNQRPQLFSKVDLDGDIAKKTLYSADPSLSNRLCIYTLFSDGLNQNLLTTGDGVANFLVTHDFLFQPAVVAPNIPHVHIFKVPHHGSKNNSLTTIQPPTYHHNDLFFALTMLVWRYRDTRPANGNPLVDPTVDEVKTLLKGAYFDDWHNLFSFKEREVTKANWKTLLSSLQRETLLWWRQRTATISFRELGLGHLPQSLSQPGQDPVTTNLILLLWRRIQYEQDCIVTNTPSQGDADIRLVAQTPYKETTLAKSFNTDREVDTNQPFWANSQNWAPIFSVDPIARLRIAKSTQDFYTTFEWVTLPHCATVTNVLSFSATNYVVSANGMHGHPHDVVIAGIVASVVVRLHPNPPARPRRIFFTDGYSVKMDQIAALVKLLVAHTPNVPTDPIQWGQYIQLWSLYGDFLAEIPTDTSAVANSEQLLFQDPLLPQGYRDQQDQLRYLSVNFKESMPYHVPRGRVHGNTRFYLTVTDHLNGNNPIHLDIQLGVLVYAAAGTARAIFRLEARNDILDLPSGDSLFKYNIYKVDPHNANNDELMTTPAALAPLFVGKGGESTCHVYRPGGDAMGLPGLGNLPMPVVFNNVLVPGIAGVEFERVGNL